MRAIHLFGIVPHVADLFGTDLVSVGRSVRRAERFDPDTRRYPRWGVSDDLCARRLRWVD